MFLPALLVGLSVATSVLAHPGHGTTSPDSPIHYLVEPQHAAVFLVVVALLSMATLIFRWALNQGERIPVRVHKQSRK